MTRTARRPCHGYADRATIRVVRRRLALIIALLLWDGSAWSLRARRTWHPIVRDGSPPRDAVGRGEPTDRLPTGRGTYVLAVPPGPDAGIWEVSADGKRKRQLANTGSASLLAIVGDKLYFETDDELFPIVVHDVATGRKQVLPAPFDQSVHGVIPTPDGRALIIPISHWNGDPVLLLHPLDGSPDRRIAEAHQGWFNITGAFVDGRLYFRRVERDGGGPLESISADGVVS